MSLGGFAAFCSMSIMFLVPFIFVLSLLGTGWYWVDLGSDFWGLSDANLYIGLREASVQTCAGFVFTACTDHYESLASLSVMSTQWEEYHDSTAFVYILGWISIVISVAFLVTAIVRLFMSYETYHKARFFMLAGIIFFTIPPILLPIIYAASVPTYYDPAQDPFVRLYVDDDNDDSFIEAALDPDNNLESEPEQGFTTRFWYWVVGDILFFFGSLFLMLSWFGGEPMVPQQMAAPASHTTIVVQTDSVGNVSQSGGQLSQIKCPHCNTAMMAAPGTRVACPGCAQHLDVGAAPQQSTPTVMTEKV